MGSAKKRGCLVLALIAVDMSSMLLRRSLEIHLPELIPLWAQLFEDFMRQESLSKSKIVEILEAECYSAHPRLKSEWIS
jgi:hypothetical protein